VKERGVFLRIMEGLATADAQLKTIMIEATCLKAHRTASSLRLNKGGLGPDWPHKSGMNTELSAVPMQTGDRPAFMTAKSL
jgi:hypothetical protein